MLAYQDLLNISPYEELFKDQQAKDKPADLGMQGISAGGADQKGSQMMMFLNALSSLASMFGGGKTSAGGGGESAPYGGSNSTGWTDVPRKAW